MTLPKTYDPQLAEDRWYETWEARGYFHAEPDPSKEPFAVAIPPPNVTGELHMGHALNNTLQDVVVRYQRADGKAANWFPGMDHASIAVHALIEKGLRERSLDHLLREIGFELPEHDEPLSRQDLGREWFLKLGWAWREHYGGKIRGQLKVLGASCDWRRERFTMDEGLSRAVRTAFVKLYEGGLIYRGERLIGWCPQCRTALSDIEVEREEQPGTLYYITYPLEDGGGELQVATTRPETLLGDTAVAVHPEDPRTKGFIGKKAILPLMDRPIPIVADEAVDPEFGTGFVKVTPGHDQTDFEIGERHGLAFINLLNPDGTLNDQAGAYAGLDVAEGRARVVEDLQSRGLLVKTEDITHAVGHCQRCGTVAEPMLSTQWFADAHTLAQPALKAVRERRIEFIPSRWEKVYFNWLEHIRPWCISRQLWWGHRIPAWHCGACGEITVAVEDPEACAHCGSGEIRQDEDVLDTWFSSALWPFSILGWPEESEDLRYFYPTAYLSTGPDIIFFWVARMIMTGLHFMEDVPFYKVFFHPLIVDEHGQKMSKSKGNVIDPLSLKEQYGVDALRFTLAAGTSKGKELRLTESAIQGYHKFLNKIWNAARLVLSNLDGYDGKPPDPGALTLEDRWVLSRLQRVVGEVRQHLDHYDFNLAAGALYNFIWGDFCDWYLEWIKPRLYGDDARERATVQAVLHRVLTEVVKLLHPFVPFIAEELWQHLPHASGESVVTAPFPRPDDALLDEQAEAEFETLKGLITAVRTMRSELNLPPDKPTPALIRTENEGVQRLARDYRAAFESLARVTQLDVGPEVTRPAQAPRKVFEYAEVFLPLEGVIDIAAERVRLAQELARAQDDLERSAHKLDNEDFLKKAPPAIVEKEQQKLEEFQERVKRLEQNLELLGVKT